MGGGCSNDVFAFFRNPQWILQIPEGGVDELILLLECPAGHSVNLRLFDRGIALPQGLGEAASSGPYRCSCAELRLRALPAGQRVLVVSTFRAGSGGKYRIVWHASQAVELRMQPHPFAAPLPDPLESTLLKVMPGQSHWFKPRVSA